MTTKQLAMIEVNVNKSLFRLRYSDDSMEEFNDISKIQDMITRIQSQPLTKIQPYDMDGKRYIRHSYVNGDKKFVPSDPMEMFTLYSVNNIGKKAVEEPKKLTNANEVRKPTQLELCLMSFFFVLYMCVFILYFTCQPICFTIKRKEREYCI